MEKSNENRVQINVQDVEETKTTKQAEPRISVAAMDLPIPIVMKKTHSVMPTSSSGSGSMSRGNGIIEEFWD
jgi:hypothetical protein